MISMEAGDTRGGGLSGFNYGGADREEVKRSELVLPDIQKPLRYPGNPSPINFGAPKMSITATGGAGFSSGFTSGSTSTRAA